MHSNFPPWNGSGRYMIKPRQALKAPCPHSSAHGPRSFHTVFSLPACTYAAWKVPYQLIGEELERLHRDGSLVIRDGSTWYEDNTWKWTAIVLQSFSRKASQREKLQVVHLDFHFIIRDYILMNIWTPVALLQCFPGA